MINQLHISTVDHDWTNTQLVPLNQHNINKIINATDYINCYTSPEDLTFEYIHPACDAAVHIHLIDLNFNNTNDDSFGSWGRLLSELVRQQHKIVGNFVPWTNDMSSTHRPVGNLIWAAGCSITHGYGINFQQRYSKLVADALDRQEVCLASPGSSIFWAADQILRTDIQSGDIVLWGLTDVARVEIANTWMFEPVNIHAYSKMSKDLRYWNLQWFNSPTQTLMAIHQIAQVQNFCHKLGAKLYLLNMIDISWMSVILTQYPNYLDLLQDLKIKNSIISYIDVGTDNRHPGPKQHQQWADKILKFINNFKNY